MKLIINADDFGLSKSVNLGIAECMKAGVIKSTTVMMNQDAVQHAISLYKQGRITQVGLHFTVTSGKPLSAPKDVPSLIDDNGDFIDKVTLFSKSDVCEEEVYRELQAQYHAAIDAGFDISHIDTHHFGGIFSPLKQAFIRFANDINLPVRRVDTIVGGQGTLKVPTPDVFDGRFFDEGVSLETLKKIILDHKKVIPDGVLELMSHPSMEDNADLEGLTGYKTMRVIEKDILTSPELVNWLKSQEIECVGFEIYSGAA